jgi:hypothetical protein
MGPSLRIEDVEEPSGALTTTALISCRTCSASFVIAASDKVFVLDQAIFYEECWEEIHACSSVQVPSLDGAFESSETSLG